MSEERETYTTKPALDLDAIEARANAATPGPWRAGCEHDYFGCAYITTPTDCYVLEDTGCYESETRFERDAQHHSQLDADAIFAAAAREDVPALVAEVRRLRAANAELHEWLAAAEDDVRSHLENDVERIGRERDDMSRANVELQERLSALEDDGK